MLRLATVDGQRLGCGGFRTIIDNGRRITVPFCDPRRGDTMSSRRSTMDRLRRAPPIPDRTKG